MAVNTDPVVGHGAWQIFTMGDGVILNVGGVTTFSVIDVLNVQPNASVTFKPTTGLVGTPLNAYPNTAFCETGVPLTVHWYNMPVMELLKL